MLGNWNPSTRTQQIDNNLVGLMLPIIRGIGFRRNGVANAGAAKKTDLTVLMSHADFNSITNTFASNYKDQPVTVFTRKTVNLPDWNTLPPQSPPPFDVILPFDTPFIYNRQDALLWDVLNDNNPQGTYSQDWVSGTPTHNYGPYPTDLGPGCITPGGIFEHRCALRADASTLQLGFRVQGAPSGAAVIVMLGLSDPGIALPGLCTTLRCSPLLFLTLAAASSIGHINPTFLVSTPYSPTFVGASIVTQALAADPAQPGFPLVLSNGLRSPMPLAPGPGQIDVKRIYNTSSTTSPTGTGPALSAVPALYAF